MKRLIVAAALLMLASPAFAQDSESFCTSVAARAAPASDHPTAAERAALQGCDSEALYYGVGRPADPVAARKCALMEVASGEDTAPFSGAAMLMTIYANGKGARRDVDLAMAYACDVGGAPMEIDGRLEHLRAIRSGQDKAEFHFCDDITSGLATGYCAAHGQAIDTAKRAARFKALTAGWSAADRAAYAALAKASEAYAAARAEKETDMSGSARAAFAIEAEEGVREEALALLESLAAGRSGAWSPARFKASDAALNAAYKAAMARDEIELGTVTHADIRATQRAWLMYRDAFTAFARVKWPAVSPDTVAGTLTDARTKVLKGE